MKKNECIVFPVETNNVKQSGDNQIGLKIFNILKFGFIKS